MFNECRLVTRLSWRSPGGWWCSRPCPASCARGRSRGRAWWGWSFLSPVFPARIYLSELTRVASGQYVNTKTWQVLRTRFPDVLNLAKYKKRAPTMQPAGLEKDWQDCKTGKSILMDVHHLVEGAAHVAEAVAAVAVGRSQRELLVAKQDMVIHQKWASFSFTIIPLKILTLNFRSSKTISGCTSLWPVTAGPWRPPRRPMYDQHLQDY